MGIIIFNNLSSKDYGILVEHPPGYQFPQKDYDMVHIPGRNGDLVIDNESYQNVERKYEIAIGSLSEKFTPQANRIAEWLHSANGYARLEDSYEPEYYRMALFKDQGEIDNILFHAGRITISFDCKPQRFLKSGDETITIEDSAVLRNPTIYKSNPIITVYGTVTGGIAEVINIGDYSVGINAIDEYVTIDSSIFDVYKKTPTGIVNKNSTVNFTNGYPKIQKGDVPITFTSGITKVEVVPRWWTL